WQRQGEAAAYVVSGSKHPFSPAAASGRFGLTPRLATAELTGTITVMSTGDGAANAANCPGASCRLRDAIAAAVAGDTIDFSVTGTITLNSGELGISKNLTINGPGAAQLTISGNQASRVFMIDSSFTIGRSTVALSGLTITNGNSGIDD